MTANHSSEPDPAIALLASQIADEISRQLGTQQADPEAAIRATARAIAVKIRDNERRRKEFDAMVDQLAEAVGEELERLDSEPLESESVDASSALPSDSPGGTGSSQTDSQDVSYSQGTEP
ncbi:MAG: hypothetical protein ACJ74U_16470 [Jatrophihabitantaceae bacterium]